MAGSRVLHSKPRTEPLDVSNSNKGDTFGQLNPLRYAADQEKTLGPSETEAKSVLAELPSKQFRDSVLSDSMSVGNVVAATNVNALFEMAIHMSKIFSLNRTIT